MPHDLPTIAFQRATDLPEGAPLVALQHGSGHVTVMISADHITEPACDWLTALLPHIHNKEH